MQISPAQENPEATLIQDSVEISKASAEPVIPAPTGKAEKAERGAAVVGSIGNFITKIPKFLAHTGRFLGATLFGGLSAAIQLAAGSLGLVGMAGLGMAGGLEVYQGIKEKDPIKVMSGSGEVVRGAFTGLLSAGHLMDLGKHAGTVAGITAGLGALQGGIHLTSGVLKFQEGRKNGKRLRRIEGLLEMGMGAASFGMITGPLTPLAVGTYAGLATARFGVANWDKIKALPGKVKTLATNYWNSMRNEYRGIEAFTEDKEQKKPEVKEVGGLKVPAKRPGPEPTLEEQCREIF